MNEFAIDSSICFQLFDFHLVSGFVLRVGNFLRVFAEQFPKFLILKEKRYSPTQGHAPTHLYIRSIGPLVSPSSKHLMIHTSGVPNGLLGLVPSKTHKANFVSFGSSRCTFTFKRSLAVAKFRTSVLTLKHFVNLSASSFVKSKSFHDFSRSSSMEGMIKTVIRVFPSQNVSLTMIINDQLQKWAEMRKFFR